MIFYFTATGNSLQAAKIIGDALGEVVDIADSMRKEEFSYELADYEKVGFVFPVFFYGVPSIVCEFIEKLALASSAQPYLFSVITCGEKIAGADRQFRKIMEGKGHKVSVCFTLVMPNNSVLWYELPSPEEQVEMLADAEKEMDGIIEKLRGNRTDGYSSGLGGRVRSSLLYSFYRHGRRTSGFFATEECTGCGLCERICPCDAITLDGDRPKWVKERCVQCLGCINRCPAAAIQYGKSTVARRRYVNPILKERF